MQGATIYVALITSIKPVNHLSIFFTPTNKNLPLMKLSIKHWEQWLLSSIPAIIQTRSRNMCLHLVLLHLCLVTHTCSFKVTKTLQRFYVCVSVCVRKCLHNIYHLHSFTKPIWPGTDVVLTAIVYSHSSSSDYYHRTDVDVFNFAQDKARKKTLT